jgi:hypothetical protein
MVASRCSTVRLGHFSARAPSAMTHGRLDWKSGPGVHTCEVEKLADDVSGVAVNLCSRIQSVANPGEVLASRTVKALSLDLASDSTIEVRSLCGGCQANGSFTRQSRKEVNATLTPGASPVSAHLTQVCRCSELRRPLINWPLRTLVNWHLRTDIQWLKSKSKDSTSSSYFCSLVNSSMRSARMPSASCRMRSSAPSSERY